MTGIILSVAVGAAAGLAAGLAVGLWLGRRGCSRQRPSSTADSFLRLLKH